MAWRAIAGLRLATMALNPKWVLWFGSSPVYMDYLSEAGGVSTIYDWASMAIFAALIVLFLHRSMAPGEPRDHILQYLPPAIGCALANYVGNQGLGLLAGIIMLAVIAYIFHILKPFNTEH